jgi:integrase
MKLTTANLDPGGKSDAIFFDDELTGFGLRVRRGSGGKLIRNWIVQYRSHGRQRRLIIGSASKLTAAEARKQARKLLAKVELGQDPQHDRAERRERDAVSLKFIAGEYFSTKVGVIKPRSLELLRHYLVDGPHLRPLHMVPIDEISRGDIAKRLLTASKESGVPTAIALRSATSSLFSWAMQMGFVEQNPVIQAYKPETPKSRDRVLDDSELAAIWRGLDDDDYGKCVKLLILTAARREEIAGLCWSEVNFDKGTWTVPKTRSKNGLEHTLPLTPLMRSIIDSVPRREGLDILFGYKRGFTGWSIGKRALDARLGLPAIKERAQKHWRHHDIRRSVATKMADIGIAPHVIEQILNHQSGHKRGPAGIYNRSSYEREVRAAMALWSDHVRALVEGGERKIVPIARSAG